MSGVAAVILAAGSSSRFGSPKQLVRQRGQALVRRIASVALAADCSPVIVVTGQIEESIRAELSDLPVEIVPNPAWPEGISSSIRAGVKGVENADAIILLTCDQPLVRPETLRGLVELHRSSGKSMVASAYADTLGIPSFFDHHHFAELLALRGDSGAKSILLSQPNETASLPFPEGAIDIDTPEDWQKFVE